jgi:hypothetical protein
MFAGLKRNVTGENDHGDSAASDRGSHRGLQRTRHLGRSRDQLTVVTASLEQKFGMRLLEIVGTDLAAWNMSRDCENRDGASMTVEKPVDEVKVAGAATPGADCKLASHVRVSAGGRGRHFLVADMDPFNRLLSAYFVDYSVERITHDTVDSLDPASTSVLTKLSATVDMIASFFPSRRFDGHHSWILNPSSKGVKNARTKSQRV